MHSGTPKKVGIIGSVGVPANYGGFETLTEYLVHFLGESFELHIGCSSKSYPEKTTRYKHAFLHYIPLKANGLQSIPYDIWSILKVGPKCDTLVILGVASGFFLPFYRVFSSKRIVLNVDGLEWKREKWGKIARWYLRNAERLAVKYADLVVADNVVIQQHISENYGKESVVIEYGGDQASNQELQHETLDRFPFLTSPYAFKVCRIEPENNIELILKAFKNQEKLHLVLVGNWANSLYGKQLKANYSDAHLHLIDPIYDQNLLDQLRSNCLVYIHGHSAGGTNPSLVEAMHLGLPILAYGVGYNRETTENKAFGYFQTEHDLLQLIQSLDFEKAKQSGADMNEIAQRRYSWKIIADKYKSTF